MFEDITTNWSVGRVGVRPCNQTSSIRCGFENFRHSVPAPENIRQVRRLKIELFHAKLDGFDRIGRVDPVVLLLVALDFVVL